MTSDEPTFKITFDGAPVPVRPGQTIGAALLAAGTRTLRTTRVRRRPRGMFCGIGVCFDCLVVVNGAAPERACLTPAAPDDVVTSRRSAPPPPPAGGDQ